MSVRCHINFIFSTKDPFNMDAHEEENDSEVSANGYTCLIQRIEANGSCMFLAVAHQLLHHPPGSREHTLAAVMIRTVSINYLMQNIDAPPFQLPLIGDLTDWPNIGKDLPMRQRFSMYAAKMLQTKMWGGAAALQSMAECLGLKIVIHQTHAPMHVVAPTDSEWKNEVHLFFRRSRGSASVDHYDSIPKRNERAKLASSKDDTKTPPKTAAAAISTVSDTPKQSKVVKID